MNSIPADTALVVSAIPYGREHAISRAALSAAVGMSDRKVRQCIEDARADGCMILNDQSGRGYYISRDLDEIERQYRIDTARALSILRRRKAMRRLLKENGRQV